MIESVAKAANVEIFNSARLTRIYGEIFVKGVSFEHRGQAKI